MSDDLLSSEFNRVMKRLQETVPPSWPLKDFVAVNPFLGFTGKTFLETDALLKQVCDVDLLPPLSYFRTLHRESRLSIDQISQGYDEISRDHPDLLKGTPLDEVVAWLHQNDQPQPVERRTVWTMAEALDQTDGGERKNQILNDITRCLSGYFDDGEAFWPMPWRNQSPFPAWKQMNSISHRMDFLGMRGFREFVQRLPDDAEKALLQMLSIISLPKHLWFAFCLAQLSSVAGWASYVKNNSKSGESCLPELLAIRLAYDAFLIQSSDRVSTICFHQDLWSGKRTLEALAIPDPMDVIRYVLQIACETSFRHGLTSQLSRPQKKSPTTVEPLAQLVFCIDVRSEPIRRQLELVSERMETLGFAGFFGMPLKNIPSPGTEGSSHCPVLLEPAFQVEWEKSSKGAPHDQDRDSQVKEETWQKVFHSFRSNPVSSLTFVETLGWLSAGKLLFDSLGWVRSRFGAFLEPADPQLLSSPGKSGGYRTCLTVEQQVDFCQGFLSNLGLTERFARFVVVCGHASDVQNSLFQAGLDCGACGGHSGEPNARVACAMLNNQEVRNGLSERGISVPESTWFVPAVHNTTTESIVLPEIGAIPIIFQKEFHELTSACHAASLNCAASRSSRFPAEVNRDLSRKSRNWGDVRPDWGLVGNAAFVVAPRSRTRDLDLGGRVFLHSYDPTKDVSGKILESIMTAPMIVTSWINLQYFASTIDNRKYGSGDKLLHNAVGKFGVLEGNGGDLRTGLPMQSIHNGESWQHQPLKLLVVIESPRDRIETIIEKHPNVHDLVSHGWISLVVLEHNQFFRWGCDSWDLYEAEGSSMPVYQGVSQ
ncbi:DUF2309 domain-containing protein [Bremerella sp. JC817]|uniref:DUF2309 domain-containing protein n=1 Tax=Bremerella sp. JC817 TaxID=3231756 RepID=UPI00345A77A8